MTAGRGSAFLPYGQGLAKVINASGDVTIEVRESKGSNENLAAVETSPGMLGLAFLGAAHAAMTGTGFAAGKKYENVRALFPMYETAHVTAALRSSGITNFKGVDGKRVGVGPAGGPLEALFRAAAADAKIQPILVNGTPAELVDQLIAGSIDAFSQAAFTPVPSLVAVTDRSDAVVFGFTDEELESARKRQPFAVDLTIAPNTYRGQISPIKTLAVWNVVIAHSDLPDAVAYAVTRAVMTAPNLVTAIGPEAAATKAENAPANLIVPYHRGAARALGELGVKVASR
jgi:TRAP transporter TAXI family solute receptor